MTKTINIVRKLEIKLLCTNNNNTLNIDFRYNNYSYTQNLFYQSL